MTQSAKKVAAIPLLELVATELGRATHLDSIILPLMEEVARRVGASAAILHLVDKSCGELVARRPGESESRTPIGQGIAGQVAVRGSSLASHELDQSARPDRQRCMAVPILERGAPCAGPSVIAVVEAIKAENAQAFDDTDLASLDALALEIRDALMMTQLDDSAAWPTRYNMIVGQSPVMREFYAHLQSASRDQSPVLLVGTTGTGKSLAARAIHANSSKRRHPWVHVRPAAMARSLVSHCLRSATTRAMAAGEECTLYIEHVTRLSRECQTELAASLRNGELVRTRLLASTRVDLGEEVAQGRFDPALGRELRAGAIAVPRLKERGADDLSRLVLFWLRDCARNFDRPARGINSDALRYLHERSWQAGGLRELRHWVERAVLGSSHTILTLHDLVPEDRRQNSEQGDHTIPSGLALSEVEERYIVRTLVEHQQNRTRAARALGIGRNTLVRKLRDYKK